jgi:1-acyl-sn-glycerol-3-phosphate acyltransferase
VQLPFAEEVRDPRALRTALVSTFRRVIRLYFRDIERLGVPPASDTRGRVFVSNHTNALIDPVVVLTDAACEISPVAKSTLWSVPGLSWLLNKAGAVPIVRRKDNATKDAGSNADVFEKIAAHLGDGGNILIFPEGTSHSEPHLAPLRSGAAPPKSARVCRRRSRRSRSSSTRVTIFARAASCCGDRSASSRMLQATAKLASPP